MILLHLELDLVGCRVVHGGRVDWLLVALRIRERLAEEGVRRHLCDRVAMGDRCTTLVMCLKFLESACGPN